MATVIRLGLNLVNALWNPLQLTAPKIGGILCMTVISLLQTNTFQCVLATNGTVAFVTFLYVDGHMQWTASDSGSTVEVGFLDDSTYLFPPTDLTDIDTRGNAGIPGKWLFRVDGQRIIAPDGTLL